MPNYALGCAYEKLSAVFKKEKESLATLHTKYSHHIHTNIRRRQAAVTQRSNIY